MKAIDLFCGHGGFTEGAMAAGLSVVWAADYDANAVKYHRINHPATIVAQQDLISYDFADVPDFDFLLASPCCQGHTEANGKVRNSPTHEASRSTARAVPAALRRGGSRVVGFMVENVVGFKSWEHFPAWCAAIEALGFTLALHEADAADYGVPQNRERLLIVGTRSKAPLVLTPEKQPWIPASSFIEWDEHSWQPIDKPGRSANTLARIAAGRAVHGERFLAPYYGSGSGKAGRNLDRPIGTITTLDRWQLIRGDECRFLQPPELRAAMGLRRSFILPPQRRAANKLLGNGVCPPKITAFLNELKRRI